MGCILEWNYIMGTQYRFSSWFCMRVIITHQNLWLAPFHQMFNYSLLLDLMLAFAITCFYVQP